MDSKYENTVIKVLNEEHGAKVIKFWQSQGVDTRDFEGHCTAQNDSMYHYYGMARADRKFDNYTLHQVQSLNLKIIELPKDTMPKRGDKILVWQEDEKGAKERIFLTFIEGASSPVIAVDSYNEEEFNSNTKFAISQWKNWKPLLVETIVELTMEDISNGNGVGIPPHLIRIKK